MTRPDWDTYFMNIALVVATRGTCDRARVGAVIVKNNRIISTGYNGSPPDMPHCDDIGHEMADGHCIRTLHAEENAILQAAAIGGTSTQGATLYTTHSTCYQCFKKTVAVGITRIVAGEIYRDESILQLANDLGIQSIVLPTSIDDMCVRIKKAQS